MSLLVSLVLLASGGVPEPAELRWDPRVDLPVTAVELAAYLSTETFLKPALAPPGCRWCATNGFDDGVRRLFNPSLTPSSNGVAGPDVASGITLGLTAGAMVGVDLLLSWRDGAVQDFWADLTITAEAALAASCVNQVVKFAVGRARPYTIGAPASLLAVSNADDQNLSFFSGHTSFVFAAVGAAGTVATMRGYRLGWLTWVVGIPLALSTTLLRLAADKHWASDTLVAMVVGAGVGVGLPLLFHGPVSRALPQVTISVVPGGLGLSGRF